MGAEGGSTHRGDVRRLVGSLGPLFGRGRAEGGCGDSEP